MHSSSNEECNKVQAIDKHILNIQLLNRANKMKDSSSTEPVSLFIYRASVLVYSYIQPFWTTKREGQDIYI